MAAKLRRRREQNLEDLLLRDVLEAAGDAPGERKDVEVRGVVRDVHYRLVLAREVLPALQFREIEHGQAGTPRPQAHDLVDYASTKRVEPLGEDPRHHDGRREDYRPAERSEHEQQPEWQARSHPLDPELPDL